MSVKAMFVECELPFWIDVAETLHKEADWQTIYWLAESDVESEVSKRIPGAIFDDSSKSRAGIFPSQCDHIEPGILDEEFLRDLSFYETVVLKMMDRAKTDTPLTFQQRVDLYHRLLGYWKGVIDHYEPDVAVFPISPHNICDYIIYVLCRKLGVKTVMFERTSLPGYIFPLRSFEEGSPAIIDMYNKELQDGNYASCELSPFFEAYAKQMERSYSEATPFHLKYKKDAIKARMSILRQTKLYVTDKKYRNKKNRERHLVRTAAPLKECYSHLTKEVDYHTPYIYVALHCQPERQTSPNGGVFVHQLLMVEMLSKLIPEGWRIYVKEHVAQFFPRQVVKVSRTEYFYNYMASLPNVSLVSLSEEPFRLIDHAKAVATVAGTTGWETIMRGKPALIFGHTWYNGCEGVFKADTVDKCKSALSTIASGYNVDREKIRLFLHVLEKHCVRGYVEAIYERYAEEAGITKEHNVRVITKAIQDVYNSNS